jgi:alkylation response protein AidB-like acyl-CoA dehydrogenase
MTSFSLDVPEMTATMRELQLSTRKFLADEIAGGGFRPRCSGWQVFDSGFSLRCAARGYIGMTIPKELGGHGRRFLERYVVVEEMLAAGAPVGAHWIADRQSGPQIARHGSTELRRAILPGITAGRLHFAIGMSEPNAGSDLAGIRSHASRADGGWVLNGRKIWTTNGHLATHMIGLFRTQARDEKYRHAGMTQFVVDLSSRGISRRPIADMTGNADFSEITFDSVFVPDPFVLGSPGDGWNLVMGELAYERSGPERLLSVMPLLRAVIPGLRAHPSDAARREVGRLIARLATLRQLSLAVAAKLDAGQTPGTEAAMAKDLGNQLESELPGILRRIDSRRPDFNGDEYQRLLAEALLQSPSITLRGGTPEILRGVIARGLGLR